MLQGDLLTQRESFVGTYIWRSTAMGWPRSQKMPREIAGSRSHWERAKQVCGEQQERLGQREVEG